MKKLGDKCVNGHVRTPETTLINTTTGGRACKICQRENQKFLYAKEKEAQRKAFEKIKADR